MGRGIVKDVAEVTMNDDEPNEATQMFALFFIVSAIVAATVIMLAEVLF